MTETILQNDVRRDVAESPYVLPFEAIDADDLPLVGGKGANLGEMAGAGFPVPPGFCVTTAAYRAFLAADPRADEIFAALDGVDPQDLETLRRAGEQVRDHLAAVETPPAVAAAVLDAWRAAGPDHAYAVRSSATAEDLPGASFAGQQDTYLNVRGADALLESVHRCWISLFTDRAILYRIQNGFDHRDVQLAVVVQRMVEPKISGILFTADPVTNNHTVASIDASYGLGEALVSGLVSADLYKVDKRTLREIEAQIAEKKLAIWPLPDGGTVQRPVEEPQRSARALPPEETLKLAELGARIEAHYGQPQDIEWAWADGQIYILQSRPITSLYPLPEPRPDDPALHAYLSMGHPQMMTDPMKPMGLAALRLLLPFGRPSDSVDYNPFVDVAGGRIYLDGTPLLLHPMGRRILLGFLTVADMLMVDVLNALVDRPDFKQRAKGVKIAASTRGILSWILPIVSSIMADLWFRNPDGRVEEVTAWCDGVVDKARSELTAAAPGAERLEVARRLIATRMELALRALAHNIGGGAAAQKLTVKLAGQDATPDDLNALWRGLSGNVTTEMDLRVGDLADAARRSPALVAHLQTHDARTALATLDQVEGGPEFRREWERFLADYGMRGPSEIDITRPRWRDDPASLIQMVLGNLGNDEPGLHRARHAAMARESEAAAGRLVAAARHGLLGPLRAAMLRRQIRVARNLLPLREHPKFMLIRIMGLARTAMLEAGQLLVDAGRIDAAGDIWFLDLIEAIRVLGRPDEELRTRIARRKADLGHFARLTPPRIITSDGEIPVVGHQRDDLPAGALPGNPVSAGVVEGIAHVITDPARESLAPGEILVAPFTDPGWTPLFINAAGLVMEVGGLMTHGSVVAREYGIPAVVGVIDATKLIETGQRVRVNGDMGWVEVLE